MEQREIDNMLLSMIQKHFPSLPLSDEYTDWGKWLRFARAVYESGRASPASAPEGFALVPVVPTHAILDVMFNAGIDMHDGDLTLLYRAILAAAPTPPVSEDRKDAEILEQCRIIGAGSERELALQAKVEQQAKLIAQCREALEYASDMTKPEGLTGCDCPICSTLAAIEKETEE